MMDMEREKKLMRIPVKDILVPEVRATSKFDEEAEAWFKATVEKYGVIQPIVVRRLPDGKFELIGGKSRLDAQIERGATEVDAIVIDASAQDALMMHIAENLARGKNDPIQISQVLNKASELGVSDEELAKITGHTVEWVRFYKKLVDLPDVYKKALQEGELTVTHLREALRLPTPEEVDYALTQTLRLGWSASVLHQYVERRLWEIETYEKKRAMGEPEAETPPPDAEKLLKYERCMCCDRTVLREEVYMKIMCKDCHNLIRYIVENIGPPKEAMDIIYKSVSTFYEYQKFLELKKKFEGLKQFAGGEVSDDRRGGEGGEAAGLAGLDQGI